MQALPLERVSVRDISIHLTSSNLLENEWLKSIPENSSNLSVMDCIITMKYLRSMTKKFLISISTTAWCFIALIFMISSFQISKYHWRINYTNKMEKTVLCLIQYILWYDTNFIAMVKFFLQHLYISTDCHRMAQNTEKMLQNSPV